MSITEALRGMDTVTCETPDEVSHMMATGESQLEARGRKVSLANPKRNLRPYTPPLRCNEDDDEGNCFFLTSRGNQELNGFDFYFGLFTMA